MRMTVHIITCVLGDGRGVMTLQQWFSFPLSVLGEVHPVLSKGFPGAFRGGSY